MEEEVKKKRGRPPKLDENGNPIKKEVKPTSGKRGRPPKLDSDGKPMPKKFTPKTGGKRGRPRKITDPNDPNYEEPKTKNNPVKFGFYKDLEKRPEKERTKIDIVFEGEESVYDGISSTVHEACEKLLIRLKELGMDSKKVEAFLSQSKEERENLKVN